MHDDKGPPSPTFGILYPGEMGSALGKLLAANGLPVVTTVGGRSPRTRRLSLEAGLNVVDSFDEVVRTAEIVFSLVPPGAALAVAEQYRTVARTLSRPPLYIDANSISLVTATRIAALLAEAQLDFVDATIHGLAPQLSSRAIVFLSGPSAPGIAELLGPCLHVKVLGDAPGQASAMKGLLAGMSKGLIALFLEMSLLAREAGMFDDLLEIYRIFYPGVMEVIERLAPTYPQHAGRRGQEMAELEQTMRSFGLTPCVVRGSRQLITALGELGLAEQTPGRESCPWTVPDVVEALFRKQFLRERQAT